MQVRRAMKYIQDVKRRGSQKLALTPATVVRIVQLGMGDRQSTQHAIFCVNMTCTIPPFPSSLMS